MSSNHNHPPDEFRDPEVEHWLESWTPPSADPAAKARLIAAFTAEITPQHVSRRARLLSLVWLARAQVQIVSPLLWLGSALLFVIGALVTAALYAPTGTTIPFVIAAPLIAAVGVALLYGEDVDPPLEMLHAVPMPPSVIVILRLALLFSFNLIVAVLASVLLAASSTQITLMPLVAAWFAPMTCLSALALLLSALLFDPLASLLISMSVWTWGTLRHLLVEGTPVLNALPDFLDPALRLPMLAVAVVAVIAALWLTERETRFSQ